MENTELIIPAPSDPLKKHKSHISKIGLFYFCGAIIISGVQISVITLIQLIAPQLMVNPNISLIISSLSMYLIANAAFGHHRTHDPRHGHPQEENDGRAMDYRLFYVLCAYVCYECNRHIYDSYLRNTKRRSRRQPDPGHSYRTVSAHSIFPYGDLRSHRRRICFPKTHHRPDSTVRTGNGYPSVRIDVCVIPR